MEPLTDCKVTSLVIGSAEERAAATPTWVPSPDELALMGLLSFTDCRFSRLVIGSVDGLPATWRLERDELQRDAGDLFAAGQDDDLVQARPRHRRFDHEHMLDRLSRLRAWLRGRVAS